MSAMVPRATLCLCVFFLLAACARPKHPVTPQLFTLDSEPDSVFPEVMTLLAELNWPVADTNRNVGLITTDWLVLGRRDKLFGETRGHWADCGSLVFSRAATAYGFQMRGSFDLQAAVGDRTQLRIQTTINALDDGGPFASHDIACASRGRLEARLADELNARLSRAP